MNAEELVDASLKGLKLGEAICVSAMEDTDHKVAVMQRSKGRLMSVFLIPENSSFANSSSL
jgi:hypothetical protein